MSILICGGAGYIGSHTVAYLKKQGRKLVVADNLSKGHTASLDCDIPFEKVDIADTKAISEVIKRYKVDAVIHFAAYSLVGESGEKPLEYYKNNVLGTLSLLDAMLENDVKKIVFSSTAAVYGQPDVALISEQTATDPINVYGRSKRMVEIILKDFERAYGIHSIALRYFNACGALEGGQIGEDHSPETHLIPIAMQAALGQREKMWIFGDDYNTPDGTCIRDYVHVTDLASAHALALDKLEKDGGIDVYNVGYGKGYSVKEIVESIKRVSEVDFPVEIGERRAGDPDSLVADSSRLKKELNWQPQYADSLDRIISTAWKWHSMHKNGYNHK